MLRCSRRCRLLGPRPWRAAAADGTARRRWWRRRRAPPSPITSSSRWSGRWWSRPWWRCWSALAAASWAPTLAARLLASPAVPRCLPSARTRRFRHQKHMWINMCQGPKSIRRHLGLALQRGRQSQALGERFQSTTKAFSRDNLSASSGVRRGACNFVSKGLIPAQLGSKPGVLKNPLLSIH